MACPLSQRPWASQLAPSREALLLQAAFADIKIAKDSSVYYDRLQDEVGA
jgi:hypothetical protein